MVAATAIAIVDTVIAIANGCASGSMAMYARSGPAIGIATIDKSTLLTYF
jgi:hypothetical protein